MGPEGGYFSPELFRFLKELSRNNNRPWFSKNKPRYEKFLLEACLRFIKDAGPKLKTISPYLVADSKRTGGSLFRIYRDIRFSKDKSPYKTNAAMSFWHKKGGKEVHTTGLYLHIAPGQSFVASGVWHPDPLTLNRVRRAIVARPGAWRRVLDSGLKVEGESLKRPPLGFDKNHEFVGDLKRKDFIADVSFKDSQVVSARFLDDFIAAGKTLDPLNRFVAEALGFPW